ncbi:DUF1462 family protein [Chloroflexota bacterium]
MDKQSIKITIIEDSRQEECEAGCGMDWSSPETVAMASQQVKARFGDDVHLTHIDLSEDTVGKVALDWSEEIKNKNLMLPLLVIDGQLRISGQFDIRQLMDTIEVEIEMGV